MLFVLGNCFAIDCLVAAVVWARRDFIEKDVAVFGEEVFDGENSLNF